MSNEISIDHPATPDMILSRTLVLRTPDGIDHDVTVSMSAPVRVPLMPADLPAYSCVLKICGGGVDFEDYFVGYADSFSLNIDALKFIRMKLDELEGTVFFLGQPYSGFPLLIDDAFGMEHLNKSENLVRQEQQKLLDTLQKRREARGACGLVIAADGNQEA